jgi:hypothetical protein
MAKFAAYSEKQSVFGTSFYRRPDGSIVEATCVEDTEGCPVGCMWPDKIDLGTVVEFVKFGYQPEEKPTRITSIIMEEI